MPFSNPIVGGQVLVIPAIKSKNYSAGVSGWRIGADGSVEFNAGTFRGSVAIGNPAGQHAILANGATGDPVDVYNSSNALVMTVDKTGAVTTIDPSSGDQMTMFGHGVFWENQAALPQFVPQIYGQGSSANGNTIGMNSGSSKPTAWVSQLTLLDSFANSGAAGIVAFQRGTNGSGTGSIGGTVVQTDDVLPRNNVLHMGSYSGTTDASGFLFPSHGCGFTPTGCSIVGTTAGGTFANLTWGVNGFSSSIMSINFHVANTGAAYANQAISFFALFWG